MANKRLLKKNIRTVCGDLAAEIIYAAHTVPGFSAEKVRKIVNDIARLQVVALERASFTFDKTARDFGSIKEYNKVRNKYNKKAYEQLRDDFNNAVRIIVKAMNDIRPSKA